MPDIETDNTTTENDAATTTVTAPSQPPSVGPSDSRLIFADDGKTWRDKFHGAQGLAQQLKGKHEKELGDIQKQIEELQGLVSEKNGSIAQLTDKLSGAAEQLGELQALRERLPELENQARVTERYRALMEYPELLNLQQTDVVKTDDGEEVEMVFNPVIDLVESTTLEGDDLRAAIKRLSSAFGNSQHTVTSDSNDEVTPGAAPAPGEPVEQDADYWRDKAQGYHAELKADPDNNDLMGKMVEAYAKAREIESQLSAS
jgi:uncharacterized coiled-coil protein SlyX